MGLGMEAHDIYTTNKEGGMGPLGALWSSYRELPPETESEPERPHQERPIRSGAAARGDTRGEQGPKQLDLRPSDYGSRAWDNVD